MTNVGMWACLTAANLQGSWDVHYEPLPPEFDDWLKRNEFKEQIGENLDD